MNDRRHPLIGELGENHMVARFREMAGAGADSAVVVGPGDDAAVMRMVPGMLVLLTCDMMVEGVHFRREWMSGEQIGWKAMAQNVSDIAAMGGEPTFGVASIAAPGDLEGELAAGIAQGLVAAARSHRGTLVGGDLVGSPGPLVVDVALMGRVEEDMLLRRSGARAGDIVLVTGRLGASAAGLAALREGIGERGAGEVAGAVEAHRRPRPRLAEARAIAATRRATAMMDLSDGLAEDLPRLCAQSGVGARIYADRIPIARPCVAVAEELQLDALELATTGGEDYELLFTCPEETAEELAGAVSACTDTPVTVIGEIVEGAEVALVDATGRAIALGSGFDHFGAAVGRGPGVPSRSSLGGGERP